MRDNEKLKAIRKALSLSQTQMANRLDIKQSYYSALERGEKQLTSKLISALFNELAVRHDWFYNANGDIFIASTNADFDELSKDLGGETRAVLDTYRMISQIYDPNLSIEELGEVLLRKAQELDDKNFYYYLKSTKEIQKERPELFVLITQVSDLIAESGIVRKITQIYFEDPFNQDLKAKSYKELKTLRIEHLESFLKYKTILPQLTELLKTFKTLFAEFDSRAVLSIYGEDEDEEMKISK